GNGAARGSLEAERSPPGLSTRPAPTRARRRARGRAVRSAGQLDDAPARGLGLSRDPAAARSGPGGRQRSADHHLPGRRPAALTVHFPFTCCRKCSTSEVNCSGSWINEKWLTSGCNSRTAFGLLPAL